MARNATFRGANLQYVAAPKSLTGLSDVTVASAANLDRLQYSSSAGKWVDVAALTTPQIEDSSADHQYIFAVSELAADRTITLPLLTGNDTFVFNAFAATLTNKTLTSPVLNTGVSGSAVLDQDDMSGNSATQLATQQSIKAYVDAQVATEDTLSELNDTTISGPASNDVLQYSGSAWVDRTYAEAGLVSLTGSETLTNKTLTSPVLNGGALTALTDLDMTSGDKTILDTIGSNTLTIGASGTTVTIPGNLTVTGTHTTVSTTNLLVSDKLITLNDGGSASSGTAVGIEVEEDSAVTGYFKTAADRAGWELKAPSTAGVLSIDPSGNSNTIAFGGSGKTFTISETATIDQDLSTTANVTHANLTATGNVTLGNAASDTVTITGTILGASPLVFEGGTADGYETTLAITDPTADRTWTLPNATDTFVGLATADTLSNKTLASPVITTGDINTPDIDAGTIDAITSLTVANNVDIGSYTLRASGFLADGLTAGQVVYTGTDGVLSSEAALAYNATSNTLTATNIAGTLTTAAQTAITSVGALNGGSITSGFGTIDTGSSAINTTGVITGGGFTIGSAAILEAEFEILDGATVTTTELNYNDTGAAVGTVVASRTVTVDSSKDVASFRNITLSGELDAGSLDVSGDADIDGTLETDALTVGGTNVLTGSLITTLGTISAGVWEGTDVGVAHGGTGVSTLTDGGVLLGSGTGAITAMSVLTDGQLIVGNGTTDPVAESGATLRTSIGVGTSNAVQFAGITGTTIDATTDFTIGDTIITDGVITDSTGLQLAADVTISGATPTLTIGDAGTEDTKIVFDGNAQDYYIGLEDAADDLVIGVGSTLGTTTAIEINSDRHIGFGAAPGAAQFIEINPTYTTGAGNSDVVRILGTMTAGDASNFSGLYIAPTFVEHSSGTHARMVSLDVRAPTITGAGATTTAVALIHLRTDASGGGSANYQIWDSTNSAYLSTSGVWTDSSHGDVKIHAPADLDIMPELLAQLNLKQYHRRTPLYDSDGQVTENEDGSTIWTDTVHSDDSYLRYGPLAEEVPEFLATADRRGIGAGYTAGFLIGVCQNHDARIEALENALGV